MISPRSQASMVQPGFPQRTYLHDCLVRCCCDLCIKVSINLSNGLLRAYGLKRLAYRERGNTTCNFPLWSVALANTGSTSKGSSTIRITFLSLQLVSAA